MFRATTSSAPLAAGSRLPGKFSGTLNEAKGPVEVAVAGQSVRIRYSMKNGIKVEQTLTALPGRKAVDNHTTFRKFE